MMLINPTPEAEAIYNLMKRAVEENGPDFSYKETYPDDSSCMYRDESNHSVGKCIIGKMMELNGTLEAMPRERNVSGVLTLLSYVPDVLPLPEENTEEYQDIVHALCKAQGLQDFGRSWQDALMGFVSSYNEKKLNFRSVK